MNELQHQTSEPRILAVGEELPPCIDESAPQSRQRRPSRAVVKRSKDRFGTINDFVDLEMRHLTPAAIKNWLVLWRDTKPNGIASASQNDIGRRAGMTDRSVREGLAELASRGLVVCVDKGRIGRGASKYRVMSQSNNSSAVATALAND